MFKIHNRLIQTPINIIWIDLKSLAIFSSRLLNPSEELKGIPPIIMALHKLRIELQSLGIVGEPLLNTSKIDPGRPSIIPELRHIRIMRDGLIVIEDRIEVIP